MPLRTLLRSSSATVVAPLLVGFVLLALDDDLTAWVTTGYWLSATGGASFALPFAATACAGIGAWEGTRLQRGRVFDQAPARSALAITFPVLLPAVAAGLLGMAAAVLMSATAAGVGPGLPHPGFVAVWVLVLGANTLVGYLLGCRFGPLIAVPLALIGAFIANAYPSSWHILWLRHLIGGGLSGCCAVDQSVDTRALWAATVFTAALCLAAALLIHHRASAAAVAAAVLVTAAGGGGAALVAYDLAADPVQARPETELVCRGDRPRICLWPEVTDPRTVRDRTRQATIRLRDAGVAVPATLTMAAHPGEGAAKLAILPDDDPTEIPAGIASGLLPPIPACVEKGQPYPFEASGPVGAWLSLTAGAQPRHLTGRVAPRDLALAQQVRAQPRPVQLRWYQTNLHALETCGTPARLRIPGGGS